MNSKRSILAHIFGNNMVHSEYKIKFSQCDPGGILYFAELFDMAHWAYEDMLNESLKEINYFEHSQIAIPLVHAEADYLKPIRLHQNIAVKIKVDELKSTSFSLLTEFLDSSGIIAAKVKTVHVCVKKDVYEKTDIPEDLRKVLSNHSS
jgi:1,4-dihydroxy-2-naphthoyl-CoA hydrolase